MSEKNYESQWWGYIYDQMMIQDLPDLLENHLRFYRSNLQDLSGPVLECGCGTGLLFLPLLADGHDMYGFDISNAMFNSLRIKAKAQKVADIDHRISIQDLESFHYEQSFDTIIIPSNTFSHLTTQESQINVLKNIHSHLAPNGRLLLDLALAGMREFVEGDIETRGSWHTWTHPVTGYPIKQRIDGQLDFNNQLIMDRCFIEYQDHQEDFPMMSRWIFKEEFLLLLRLAGFENWESFSTPEKDPLELGIEKTHSYWIVYKA